MYLKKCFFEIDLQTNISMHAASYIVVLGWQFYFINLSSPKV